MALATVHLWLVSQKTPSVLTVSGETSQSDTPWPEKSTKAATQKCMFAPAAIEAAITTFETTTNDIFLASHRHHEPTSNLSRPALQELRAIKWEKKFMVTATDKNLSPAELETEFYIQRALTDHLLNCTKYLELSENEALATNELVFCTILYEWVDGPSNNDETKLYFKRKLCGLCDADHIIQQCETLQFLVLC